MNKVGVKYDQGKPPVFRGVANYFPDALAAVAEVSAFGAEKYVWEGWRAVPDAENRYLDALARHLLAVGRDGTDAQDQESGLLHLEHLAWNALAVLQLRLEALKCAEEAP